MGEECPLGEDQKGSGELIAFDVRSIHGCIQYVAQFPLVSFVCVIDMGFGD